MHSVGGASCPGGWWACRGKEVEKPWGSAGALSLPSERERRPGVQMSFLLLICGSWGVTCPQSSQEGVPLDSKTLLVTDEAKVPGRSVPTRHPKQARNPGHPEGQWWFGGEPPRMSRVAVQLPV